MTIPSTERIELDVAIVLRWFYGDDNQRCRDVGDICNNANGAKPPLE